MKKILIVTLSNLGDVILTLPVFQAIHTSYPKAELHVIVGQGASQVFEGDVRISRVTPFNKKMSLGEKVVFLKKIRQERYDAIIDLKHSWIGFFGGAKKRNHYFSIFNSSRHHADKHFLALSGMLKLSRPETSFLNERLAGASASPVSDKRVLLAAVGSKSDIKKWPAEYYAKLLDRLSLEQGCEVTLIGDKSDTKDAEKVKSLMRAPVLDKTGNTNFLELCNLLKKADLLITNDSAPLHIADALKIPVLAIFGPTDPRKYGPRGGHSKAIRRPLFCSPCEKAQCRYHHECMTQLGVDEVYQKALSILRDEFTPKNFKVLMVRLDRMGDLVLSLPSIAAVKKRFPNSFISVMVRAVNREIVEGHPLVDEVIVYEYNKKGRHSFPLGYFRFLRELISRRFDAAFVLHPSIRANLLPFLAGIPYRVGFSSQGAFLLTHKAEDSRHEGLRHESEYTMDVVRAFGVGEIGTTQASPVTFFSEHVSRVKEILKTEGLTSESRIITLHAGASCISKKWPRENFLELAKEIAKKTPCRVAVVGGGAERETGEFLKKGSNGQILDLTGRLGLKELAAFLSRSEILVTNDSGPAHVAASVGTPTLTIFGRNKAGLSAVRWKALGVGHRVLQKDVGCAVCLAHRCSIDFECLKAIQVEDVFSALNEMLKTPAESIR